MLIISNSSKHDRISHYNGAWQSGKQQHGKLVIQVLDGESLENIQFHATTLPMRFTVLAAKKGPLCFWVLLT